MRKDQLRERERLIEREGAVEVGNGVCLNECKEGCQREREKERERNNEVAKLCVSIVEEQTG